MQRKRVKKMLQRGIAFGVTGIMILSEGQVALTARAETFADVGQDEAEVTQYMDCFQPMPIISTLLSDCWGAEAVGARDQSNGLEDKEMKNFCYWDGSIIKDEESQKYYMFASRWAQNGGHWGSEYDGYLGWRGSQAIRAVSDSLYGPYVDEGPIWPDYYDGAGHNVFALQLSKEDPVYEQYKYAVVVSDVGRNGDDVNGTIHLSDSLTGEWNHDAGKMNVNTDQFGLSNISIMVRPDGRYEATNRNGDIAVADSITGPWEVVERKLWWKVPGMSPKNIEDPVIWYSDGLYHCVVNKWDARHAYYLTSEDGIHNWKLHPGTAYTPDADFLSYEDGTMNSWTKLERPNVYIEDGTLKAMTFAVIDVQKEEDYPNDTHGSKVIVVPFAGEKLGEFASRKDELERRGGILPAEDSNIQSWYEEAGKNYGAEPYIQLQGNHEQGLFGEGNRRYDSYDCKIGYLKYDLSQLEIQEDGEDIDCAYLSLVYMKKEDGNASKDQIQVSLAESGWTEGSGREETNSNYTDSGALTWWNQPALSYDAEDTENTTAVSEVFSLADTDKEVTIDVTELVKQFKQGETEGDILSFALSETAGGNRIQIGSKEAGEKYAAKLNIYKKREKEIASAEDIQVSTTVGTMPVLPSSVEVTFTDGTKGMADVQWKLGTDVAEAAGVVTVVGKICGYNAETSATVDVRYSVYASDFDWINAQQAEGIPAKDRTAGGNELKVRTGKLSLPTSYEKGIGTLADSEIEYDVDGKGYESFRACISLGYDYGQSAQGAVVFKVYADDETEPRYTSPVMTSKTKGIAVDVDIKGASRVRLVTEAKAVEGETAADARYNVADWCDAKFVGGYAAAETAIWDENQFIYIERGEIPELPETVEVQLKDGNTAVYHVEWQNLTEEVFQTAGFKKIEGMVNGTEDIRVEAKIFVDFNAAVQLPETEEKIARYSMSETFAYVTGAGNKVKMNALDSIHPDTSLIYQWTDNLLVENCTNSNYGFDYGVYPNPNNANPEYLVIRAPYMKSFVLRGTAQNSSHAGKNFSLATSSDGTEWTAFDGYVKTEDDSRGDWESRLYTAEGLPEDTHYVRIAFPASQTWEFNLNEIHITGGTGPFVTIAESEKTLRAGDSYLIQAKVTPEGTPLTYTSGNEEVAAVSEDGTVTAVKEGTAVITVSCEDEPEIKAEVRVTVKAALVPVLKVSFDEKNADDESGNANNGIMTGNPAFVDGVKGKAIYFSNPEDRSQIATQYVNFGQPEALKFGTESFSIMFWYKADPSEQKESSIVSNKNWESGDNAGFNIGDMREGINLNFNTVSSGKGRSETGRFYGATDNTWHHVTAVIERGNEIRLYFDGREAFGGGTNGTGKYNSSISAWTGSVDAADFVLGADGMKKYGLNNACVDELLVYKEALTQEEITNVYMGDAALLAVREMEAHVNTLEPGCRFTEEAIAEMQAKISAAKEKLQSGACANAAQLLTELQEEYETFLNGADANVSFHLISDVHVSGTSGTAADNWKKGLEDMKAVNPSASALLSAGDNTNNGSEREVKAFFQILKENHPFSDTDGKTMIALGNHDVRGGDSGIWESFPSGENGYWKTAYSLYMTNNQEYMPQTDGKPYFDYWINGYHFLVLNPENSPKDTAFLTDEQLTWLEEKLEENEDAAKPVFVMIHQALDDTHWRSFMYNGFGKEDKIVKTILAKHPQAILMSGHIHNGFGVVEAMDRPYGTVVDVPAFVGSEYGLTDAGTGYEVYVYDDEVLFRARNFVTSQWLPKYDISIKLKTLPVLAAEAKSLKEDNYTKESWAEAQEILGETLTEAKELMGRKYENTETIPAEWFYHRESRQDIEKTQKKIREAFALLTEKEVTIKPDRTGLNAAIKIAESLAESNYTAESYAPLRTALAEAKEAYAAENLSEEEIKAQIAKLETAVKGLRAPELSMTEEELQQIIDNAEQMKADAETAKSEAQTLKSQAEQQIAEANRKIAEAEQMRTDAVLSQEETEQMKADAQEQKKAAEKLKSEAEQQIADANRKIAEAEQMKADAVKAQEDARKEKADAEKAKADAEKAKAEALRAKEEFEKLKASLTPVLKIGDSVTVKGIQYRVTNAEKKEAEAYGAENKNLRSISVAASVKIQGVTCKVTAVGNGAFAKLKKVRKAVIGKNVISIGKKAFYMDKKLKNITINGKTLKSVGKQALKGISAKAVIKVPKAKKKAYKNIFKGKGQKKTVRLQFGSL